MTQQQQQVEIGIARIYLKDLSFESPKAPHIFQKMPQPELKIEVNVTPKNLSGNLYEVSLNLLVEALTGEENMFIVEAEQAGIFEIKGANPQQLDHILTVFCPGTLFTYIRSNIDQALVMGSLPPLMLAPINFEAMRNQRLQNPAQMPQA